MKSKRPYIVFCTPYIEQSAGVKVLHYLVHHLNKKGQEAYIQTWPCNNKLFTPVLACEEQIYDIMQNRNGIGILSENIEGNPFKTKKNNVVRWILNKPGLFYGKTEYDSTEHIYTYHKVLNRFVNNVEGHLLLPMLDSTIFKDNGCKRNIETFYTGKCKLIPGKIDTSKMQEIKRTSGSPTGADYISTILQHSKVLYSFDPFSAINFEAVMCGCPVVIFTPETEPVYGDLGANGIGVKSEDIISESEYGTGGICFDVADIDKARNSIGDTQERYRMVQEDFEKDLKIFIERSHTY